MRIIIPSLQVTAFVGTFAFKFAAQHWTLTFNTDPLQDFIWALNYPIWIVTTAILNWAQGLPDAWGWLTKALELVVGVLLLPSVAFLWYWVVVEFELRWHGRSMIRFSSWAKELAALALLMLIAGRALYVAYNYEIYVPYAGLFPFTAIATRRVNWLLVMIWGIILAGLGIYELAVFLKTRGRGATAAAYQKQKQQ